MSTDRRTPIPSTMPRTLDARIAYLADTQRTMERRIDAAQIATLTSTYVSVCWDMNDLVLAGDRAGIQELRHEKHAAEVALFERVGAAEGSRIAHATSVGMASNVLGL